MVRSAVSGSVSPAMRSPSILLHQRRGCAWHREAGDLGLAREQGDVLRHGAAPGALLDVTGDPVPDLLEREDRAVELALEAEHVDAVRGTHRLGAGLTRREGRHGALEVGRGLAGGDLAESAALGGRRAVGERAGEVAEAL